MIFGGLAIYCLEFQLEWSKAVYYGEGNSMGLIFLGWALAWKLVLVHVPLVQEIFGLRKKTVKPKPENRRRLSKFYGSRNSSAQAEAY